MLRSLIAAMSLCSLLIACNTRSDQPVPSTKKSGINLEDFDKSVTPQGDFYRYVNGAWLDRTVIPDDKSILSSFTVLSDLNEERLRTIVEEAAAQTDAPQHSPAQQVGDFYKSFMNTELLEARALEPLKEDMARVENVKSHDDLVALFQHFSRIGVRTPIYAGVGVDSKDATQYIVYLVQSGTSLPDRDYYLADSEKMASIRAAYQTHIAKILTLAGLDGADAAAKTVLELETRFAENHWTRVQNRDSNKTYNRYTQDELEKEFKGFPWKAYFQGMKAGDSHIVARQPDYFKAYGAMFREVSLEDWKTWSRWSLLNSYAAMLTSDFQQAEFDFFGKTLSGQKEQRPRWKRAVDAENQILGELVGKVYVQKHFQPEAKERMKELVANLKLAFAERLDQLDWMSEETKKEAHAKLARFNAKIGYPDKWRDYANLEIDKDDLVGNYMRASMLEYDRDIDRLGKPIDRDEWGMNPQRVNAYYSPNLNEIVFPAAILQPPFFDMEADDAANYGGIGAVIGHEITHGFDDQGRKYDGHGNLRDWWTENDGIIFDKRAKLMVEQYNAFKPLDDMAVNGELTLGENIADLGGITMAYYAYKRSLDGKPAPVIDGFTGEQRLFLAWGQIWRRKYREETLRQRLATDSHSPGYCRAVGPLRNMPEFYEAFGVKESDAMYRNDDIRIKIW